MLTKLGIHISTQKGFAFKSSWYCQEGASIVKVSDFTDDSVDTTGLTYIPQEIAADLQRYRLNCGDVVIQTVGSWPNNPQSVVGKAIKIPSNANGALLNQNAVRLDPVADLDKTYLFYLLRNEDFKSYIVGCAQGAASQASITLDAIREYSFELPPLPIQRKIADVLSAYDDLVEINTRRIRILEQMAQSVYREWFGKVDERSLPEGWTIRSLQDTDICIIDGDRGKNYPAKNEFAKDGYCLFLNAGNFKDDRFDYSDSDFIAKEKDNRLRKGRLQPNDIVLTTRGTVGKLAIFTENSPYKVMRINSGMVILRPIKNSLFWYFLLKSSSLKEQYKSFASGSAQPQLPIKDMNKINVLVPNENVVTEFCSIVEPFASQIEILLRKNANLRRTRDLLLPRLVSGEAAVCEQESRVTGGFTGAGG